MTIPAIEVIMLAIGATLVATGVRLRFRTPIDSRSRIAFEISKARRERGVSLMLLGAPLLLAGAAGAARMAGMVIPS